MNNDIMFSVVMPVYNVEKYLVNAINSILNQTKGTFEIILVDDCSPDNSGRICDEFANKYKNIRVLHHKKNMGLSTARNSGLDLAIGQYIFFMDSDDSVENDLFEKILLSIDKNKADVIVFGMVEDYYDKGNKLNSSFAIPYGEDKFLSTAEAIHNEVIKLEEKTFYGYAWNKFYKLSYLKSSGVRFEVITLIEDIKFNVKIFQNITKLNILNITPYHYKKRIDSSLTNKFVKEYYKLHRERIEMIYNQYKDWDSCTREVKKVLGNIYVRYIFSALQRNCDKRSKMNHTDRKKWLNYLYNDKLFIELIQYASTENKALKIMILLLKHKHKLLVILMGRIIFIVKDRSPIIFAKFKQNR